MPIVQSSNGSTKLFHPIFSFENHKTLDFQKLSFLDMGTIFKGDCTFTFILTAPPDSVSHIKAVTVTCHGNQPLVLGINAYYHRLMLKCSNENWKVFPYMSMKTGDICIFKRRLYAVYKTGRTIMVRPDGSSFQVMAKPFVCGQYLKRLVESQGDLLLADVCKSSGRVDLFKLNEKEKKWVKLTSLGDNRVLFLGYTWSFSASTFDLRVAKGNCVIFVKIISDSSKPDDVYVFDLDEGQLSPIFDYPEYSSLFCEPPEWIFKS
jgi:hypothetical protein